MKPVRNFLRWVTPFGLIERHRRRFQLHRLGLSANRTTAEAVAACRYNLWPRELRQTTQPWTLVDVGANRGEFTAAVACLTRLNGVHAFEPQPECHPELRRVLAAIPNGRLYPAAVGARQGEIELLCTANSKLASVLAPESKVAGGYPAGDFAVANRVKVPLVRLDDIIPAGTAIGLLKIDVQGYELPVLEGAKTILRSTFTLLLEVNYVAHYEGGVTFDALHDAVCSHGFRTVGISEPYSGNDGPLWADALFVRAG